ncbi:MAG: AAA family ATPase [Geminicoccales bacterium]
MKRVLLTGMSGTGKSTVIRELAACGYKAVDADEPGWSELVYVPGHPGVSASAPGQDWVWREDRIQALLSTEDADALFLSGCASNQGKFYPQFDHVVLLSAPVPLMMERLATRTTNPYGKHPDELAMVLHNTRTIEPLLRRGASLEVDTSAPVEQVVETILDHVRPSRQGPGGEQATGGAGGSRRPRR